MDEQSESMVDDQSMKPHQAALSCSRDVRDAGDDVTVRQLDKRGAAALSARPG